MTVREMAVAGMFYPAKKEALEKVLKEFFSSIGKVSESEKSNAIVSPHAGYVYSGQIAAIAFSALKKAKTFVILCPNHTGLGLEISVSGSDYWQTPFGKIPVNKEFSEKIVENCSAEFDEMAHVGEHAIEVQLPFLQYFFKDFKIVAITIGTQDLQKLRELGKAIALAEKETGKEICLIASSDFTHYEPLEIAMEKDLEAIKKIESLDLNGFYKLVAAKNLSICGFAGIASTIQYSIERGFKKGVLLKYGSSATASHDKSSVVGYAAIKFE